MTIEFGLPFTPRDDKTTAISICLIGSSLAIPVIAITSFNECSSLPGLTTMQFVWFGLKLIGDFMELWWNIPKDMGDKKKLLEPDENGAPKYPGAALVCGLKDFLSIGFLGLSVAGFVKVAPEFGTWGGDECSSAVFTTSVMCFGIPTLITAMMLFYVIFLGFSYLINGKESAEKDDLEEKMVEGEVV